MRASRRTVIVVAAATLSCFCFSGPVATAAAQSDFVTPPASTRPRFEIVDLYHFQSAAGVDLSPDDRAFDVQRVAFRIERPSKSNGNGHGSHTKQSKPLMCGQTNAGRGGGSSAHWSPMEDGLLTRDPSTAISACALRSLVAQASSLHRLSAQTGLYQAQAISSHGLPLASKSPSSLRRRDQSRVRTAILT
jgi:hypothetical protein